MPDEHLPVYQIRDFHAQEQKGSYFYLRSFAAHLREHQFIQRPHKHDFYILLYISKGHGTHTIDFEAYPVQANTMFFLAPGQVHSWQLSDDTDGYIIFFTSAYFRLEFPHQKLNRFPFFHAPYHKPLLLLHPSDGEAILEVIRPMQREHEAQKPMAEDVIRDYLDILLILLRRRYQEQNPSGQIPAPLLSQLQALEQLIDKHYREHQPVRFYADKLHVTAKQLNDTCRRAINKTVNELIQERVLLEARRLLVHSHLTVSEVAARLGYFDNAYFFRFFKKHTGQTPEQFRNAQH